MNRSMSRRIDTKIDKNIFISRDKMRETHND